MSSFWQFSAVVPPDGKRALLTSAVDEGQPTPWPSCEPENRPIAVALCATAMHSLQKTRPNGTMTRRQ